MKHLLKIIYACTLIPFFYFLGEFIWTYYRKTRCAVCPDNGFDITPGMVILLICLLLLLVSVILCLVFVLYRRSEWKKLFVPFSFVLGSLLFLEIASDIYRYVFTTASVRIINDTNKKIDRIWSAHFERVYNEKEDGNDFVVNYHPVYTYTWNIPSSTESMWPYDTFSVSPVFIDIVEGPDSISTYRFLHLKKGECETVKLSDILAARIERRSRMWEY